MIDFTRSVARSLSASWRTLLVTDLLFKLLAFAVLVPLFGLLWQCLFRLAGQRILSDVDIAMFFAGPFGWFCLVTLGTVWLAIIGLELGTLLWILAARSTGAQPRSSTAIRYALGHGFNVLAVTTRLISRSLLVIAPFLLIAGGVYLWLLTEYDINYYLNENPTEFKVAIAIAAVLAVSLAGLLLRIHSSWFLALPLVLFERVPPGQSLSASQKLIAGRRIQVLLWLVTWLAAVFLANIILTAIVAAVGQFLMTDSVDSLVVLATRVGLMLTILAAAGLLLNVLATIAFAGMLFHAYQRLSPASETAIAATIGTDVGNSSSRVSFLTTPRLIAGSIIAVLLAALIGYGALQTISFQDEVEIMAHRGASKAAPENTLAAIRQAMVVGADWVEIDVQETADGQVVVVHDSDFMKLSNNSLKIWDANFDDLADIDIGSWFDPKFANERVPKLAEVLRLCKDKIGVNIELKYYGHDQQLEQRVVDIVEAENMADQIMIMSLEAGGVAKMKALRPTWKCGLLMSVHVGDLKEIEADFLAVNSKFATRSFVNRAHTVGKEVFVWTVNEAADISSMLNRNVDGILTDRPELARQVLHQRANMDTRERLLTEVAGFFNQPPNKVEQ